MDMKASKLEKLFQKNFNRRHKFRGFADFIIDHHTAGLDNERKEALSSDVALGMIMGAEITKNRNLLIGGAIGVGVTALTIGAISKIKKLRKTKDKTRKDWEERIKPRVEAALDRNRERKSISEE